MNRHEIFTVFLKELRDSLRDRRTLISMIVIPTMIMPVLMFGVISIMSRIVKKAREEATSVIILNGSDSPTIVKALQSDKKFRIVTPGGDYRQLISNKKVRVAVDIPIGFETSLKEGRPQTVKIYHYESEMKSDMGAGELEKFFTTLREKTVERRLTDKGLPLNLVKPFNIKRQNVAPPEKVGGNIFGGIIPYIIILLCFTGAMYPAIDLTAGEKERGTMETLLCSPVKRINIVIGKFLMVFLASITTILLSLSSIVVMSLIIGLSLPDKTVTAAKTATASGLIPLIDPLGLFGVLLMILPVAVFFSALLLAVSLFAKSHKEAQSYVSPLIIVIIMPAIFGALPGIELNIVISLIPILNLSLVCKEMLSGVWHWSYITLIFGSTSFYAALSLAFCVRLFNREDIIFRS